MPFLVVIGDLDSRNRISKGLRELGNQVDEADNATDGFFLASNKSYDGIVLNRILHDICGLSLLSFMRDNSVRAPVIVVSDRSNLDDTLAAFKAGADDYMNQPIKVAELAVRMQAIRRRGDSVQPDSMLTVNDLTLNRLTRQVFRAGVEIQLQPRSFSLLETLMAHAGSVVTRTMLLERVWEYHFDPRTSVIETHISRLRDKIDRPFGRPLIRTIRGGGYMIGEPARMCSVA